MEATVEPAVIADARRRQRRRRAALAVLTVAAAVSGTVYLVSHAGGGSRAGSDSRVGSRAITASPLASSRTLEPRQAITLTTVTKILRGRDWIGLGLRNVSLHPAVVRVSVKGRLPLTRSEVQLNPADAKFRDGTVIVRLPANHANIFLDLAIVLPKGSTGNIDVALDRDFGPGGTPSSQIASIAIGP